MGLWPYAAIFWGVWLGAAVATDQPHAMVAWLGFCLGINVAMTVVRHKAAPLAAEGKEKE